LVAFPFFGVTVTVTLQAPTFSAFTLVPVTLQNFAEVEATATATFAPEGIVPPADLNSEDPDTDLPTRTVGLVVETSVVAGAVTWGAAVVTTLVEEEDDEDTGAVVGDGGLVVVVDALVVVGAVRVIVVV
jgi:hypothetical protein